MCNYIKIEKGWNFQPVLKIVTCTAQRKHRLRKMLMLLSMHMTSVIFLVQFNNFGLLLELHTLTLVACSYALLLHTSVYTTGTFYIIVILCVLP